MTLEDLTAARSYRPVIAGRRGAVAANHPLATQAGLLALQAGGSAADAAVAVSLTLGVVEPFMSGIGGDGFLHWYERASGEAVVINATGSAPTGATPDRFAAGIPLNGPLSVSTPGIVGGLGELHRLGGRLPWAALFEGAIHAAREGFGATPSYRRYTHDSAEWVHRDARTSASFFPGGALPPVGGVVRQPALARTLEALADEGADAFYRGALGHRLAAALAAAGTLVTRDDLESCRPELQDPIRVDYRGYEVRNSPPNSVGWVLLQELRLAELGGLAALEPLSADAIHLMVEAKRIAFADREEWAGDPRHGEIPVERFLDAGYAAERFRAFDPRRAGPRPEPGLRRRATAGARGGIDTTYFAVVDGEGNAVSGIQSINGGYGSGVTAGDTGIVLNNRITPFHLEPGHPNQIAPGKRVRHTMNTPMAFRDGELVGVFGTPGGDYQVQVNLQVLTLMLDHGWDPQRAAEAPRWASSESDQLADAPHTIENMLELESRFPAGVSEDLRRRGHPVVDIGPLDGPCSIEIIRRDPATGMLLAGSDPRRDGWALAW